jgi:hypothetical protein
MEIKKDFRNRGLDFTLADHSVDENFEANCLSGID